VNSLFFTCSAAATGAALAAQPVTCLLLAGRLAGFVVSDVSYGEEDSNIDVYDTRGHAVALLISL
jgi:hypothetical protein